MANKKWVTAVALLVEVDGEAYEVDLPDDAAKSLMAVAQGYSRFGLKTVKVPGVRFKP